MSSQESPADCLMALMYFMPSIFFYGYSFVNFVSCDTYKAIAKHYY